MTDVDFGLTELIPLALIIALSPLSIIPGILMLHTPRPRATSLTFLAGWLLGILVVTAAFVGGADISGGLNDPPRWAPYVRIVLGAALVAFALYRWMGRQKSGFSPRWMTSLTGIGPRRAFFTGILLTLANLKVFLMCAAAGVAIGTAGLGRPQAGLAVAVFTAVAASTVALPTLAYQMAGPRLDAPLERIKEWMEQNHAALVAAILGIIGAALLYKGVHGL